MARMGGFNTGDLERFRRSLNKIQEQQVNAFCEECAKELAARLLAKVIKRTPVGDYDTYWTDTDGTRIVDDKGKDIVLKRSGKRGGTLRRGWTAQNISGAEGINTRSAQQFVDALRVNHFGDMYVIEITNNVEYASYVENGHRTANHKGWVRGQFMMKISEQEVEEIAPALLEKKIKKFLGGAFQ